MYSHRTNHKMELIDDEGEYIKSKYLIAYLNDFVQRTTSFLTRITQDCENRLLHFNRRIHQLESKLTLLETNLGLLSISM